MVGCKLATVFILVFNGAAVDTFLDTSAFAKLMAQPTPYARHLQSFCFTDSGKTQGSQMASILARPIFCTKHRW
jgi:hypothetical protein